MELEDTVVAYTGNSLGAVAYNEQLATDLLPKQTMKWIPTSSKENGSH